MKKQRQLIAFCMMILLAINITMVFAEEEQESGISTDEDSLFGDEISEDDMFGEDVDSDGEFIQEISADGPLKSDLLESVGVELGGRYHFAGEATWGWNSPSTFVKDDTSPDSGVAQIISELDTDVASFDLGATVFFDARPDSNFRVFGKASLSYPFDDDGGDRQFDDNFQIDELFSDFNWDDILFFRGGKHTINWGVGYFFSPADLLNLTEIDPADPEAEREGPLSLKAQLPLAAHNFYLYFVANRIETWDQIGIAGKAEFVVGPVELGIGALYQTAVAPSAMLTLSVPVWDIDFFGEAVLRYGSDRTFVEESDTALLGVEAVTYEESFFSHATAGFSFFYTFEADDSSVFAVGQYLYNGEGYKNPQILLDYPVGVGALLELGDLTYIDLRNSGRHYAAVSAVWRDIFGTDFTLSGFWMHNFSDMSGYVAPSLSLLLFDSLEFFLSVPYYYGQAGEDLSPLGENLSISLGASFGNGSF